MDAQKNLIGVFTRRQKICSGVVISTVILCILTVAYVLTVRGNNTASEQIQQYLSELSYQTSYKVNQRVDFNFNVLYSLNDELDIVQESQQQDIIQNVQRHSAFQRIGHIDSQGILHCEDMQLDVSHTNILTDLEKSRDSISDTLIEHNGEKGIVYAVSSNREDSIALAGWITTDTMLMLMNTDTFKGIGFSHVVSLNGDYILKSNNIHAALNSGDNFFEELEKHHTNDLQAVEQMRYDMQEGGSGTIEFQLDGGEKRSLTYVPLEKGEWYLFSIVPTSTYVYDIQQFTSFSIFVITVISVLLFTFVVGTILFISMRKNKIISDIAYVDPVTKGFTTARFNQKMKELMQELTPFAYVLLDIRKFKLINELKGRQGGDAVLKHVHAAIQRILDENEYVSRIQADHFEIILQTTDKEKISRKLHSIAEEINRFNTERENPYYLPIDCGVYTVNEYTQDIVQIRDRANVARKNNKESSQTHLCSCVYYNDLERLQMVYEKEIDNAMEKALENEEFVVYLQPKIDIKRNKIAGAEALIRWNSPTMGFLAPEKFIPYFEKTGFITKLDEYVFEQICKQLQRWLNQGIDPVPISVNLSKRDLYDHDYLSRYKKIQENYGIPSKYLEIEFTETMFFENLEKLKHSIDEVHQAGYMCSIDDFGSGYSSLALLKEIPVDIIKLDKAFFDHMSTSRSEKVVEHVIALAKDLQMSTIAEGVETVMLVNRLREMQCDMIQGYVYYKPMSIEDYDKIVAHDFEIIDIASTK